MDKRLSILITGGSGYVGQNLVRRAAERFKVSWTYHKNPVAEMPDNASRLDIRDFKATQERITRTKPSVIYHLAYDREDLYGTVIDGTNNVIRACKDSGIKSAILSTDCVFDGERGWYTEKDTPRPIFDYGRAKYQAEEAGLKHGSIIIRTSLVYGFCPLDPRTRALFQGLASGEFSYLS